LWWRGNPSGGSEYVICKHKLYKYDTPTPPAGLLKMWILRLSNLKMRDTISQAGGEHVFDPSSYLGGFKERITLPETNSSHLKMDGWKTIVSFWDPAYFQVRTVSCRDCKD